MIRMMFWIVALFAVTPAFADFSPRDPMIASIFHLANSAEDRELLSFSPDLYEKTRLMFRSYQAIANADEAANLDDWVGSLTKPFAEDFAVWSLAVAHDAQGPPRYRAAVQEIFGRMTMEEMVRFAPMHSVAVDNAFRRALAAELTKINVRYKNRLMALGRKHAAQTSQIRPLEGATAALLAVGAVGAVQHLTGGWVLPDVAGIVTFLASYVALKWVWTEGPNKEMFDYANAINFNAKIKRMCEELLR